MAQVLLINKVDLLSLGAVDFDLEKAKADASRLNRKIEIFSLSARTGEGFDAWLEWLQDTHG